MNLDNVTLITVVTEDGQVFEKYGAFPHGVTLSLQDDGKTLKVFPKQSPPGWRGGEEKYIRLKALVDSGASLNEIRRTMGTDYRVVKRWFPEREEWPAGGGGDAYTIRQVNQDLQRMDDYGNMSTSRGKR